MSKIDFSTGLIANYANRMANNASGSNVSDIGLINVSNGTTTTGTTRITVMKGVPPVAISTLTNITDRASDVILTFNSNTTAFLSSGELANSVTSASNLTVNTLYKQAAQTAVATWFWWVVYKFGTNTPLLQSIVGDVGLMGSGCNLEIPDTNLILNQSYRISNLKLKLPTTWTY